MFEPTRYRKRPVVVEAMLLSEETAFDVARWSGATVETQGWQRRVTCLQIPTLEGPLRADIGNWVIRGWAGEFYPCKADIFDATYEEA